MVTVLDGEVTRTWKIDGHIVNLYHDAMTGVRCAMLDYQEIPNSMGTSSMFMDQNGDQISFFVNSKPCYLIITKHGMFGFNYQCLCDGREVQENTQLLEDQVEIYLI